MPPNSAQASGGSDHNLGEVIVDGRPWPLVIDERAERFEAHVGEHVAFITFHARGSALSLIHTEAPPALRGKGVAESLARSALNYARDHGMTVKPYCPFVAGYISRHREYECLMDPEFAAAVAAGRQETQEGRR